MRGIRASVYAFFFPVVAPLDFKATLLVISAVVVSMRNANSVIVRWLVTARPHLALTIPTSFAIFDPHAHPSFGGSIPPHCSAIA